MLSLEVGLRFPALVLGAGPLLERSTSAVSRRTHYLLCVGFMCDSINSLESPPAVQSETCMTRERSFGILPRIYVAPQMIRPKPDRKQTPCQPPLLECVVRMRHNGCRREPASPRRAMVFFASVQFGGLLRRRSHRGRSVVMYAGSSCFEENVSGCSMAPCSVNE